jgi:hypothetical protein
MRRNGQSASGRSGRAPQPTANARSCRNECDQCAYLCMPWHIHLCPSGLADGHRAAFPIVMIGNQIADSARVASRDSQPRRTLISTSSERPCRTRPALTESGVNHPGGGGALAARPSGERRAAGSVSRPSPAAMPAPESRPCSKALRRTGASRCIRRARCWVTIRCPGLPCIRTGRVFSGSTAVGREPYGWITTLPVAWFASM